MLRSLACCVLVVTACADSDEPPPGPPITDDVCAAQATAGDLILCTRAFADYPRVHLPDDVLGADGDEVIVFAGATPGRLWLRDGREVALRDADGEIELPIGATEIDAPRVPAGFAWPSYELARTLYRVHGTWRAAELDGVPAIVDPIVVPVVRLAPEVLDGAMTGAWEGTMSRRTGPDTYDEAQRVPVRVRWTGYAAERTKLVKWTHDDAALDDILTAEGELDNATAAVTLADGTCAPALASLGEGSPIFEADAHVEMLRVVDMHLPGDMQLSFEGGMGSMMPALPAAFLQTAPRAAFTTIDNRPHGAPNGMLLRDFHAVTGGGAPCAP